MADDDVADAIESNAQAPRSATGDTGSVTMHSLPDQIAADKYLGGKRAFGTKAKKKQTLRGLMSVLVPPGGDGPE